MNKKIIGIMVCVLFFGVSVNSVLSGNVERLNIVENKVFFNNPPNEEWNKTFGGINNENAYCVQQTQDGGYVMGGSTNSFGTGSTNAWVIKTNETGFMEWNITKGGNYPYYCEFINQTSNGDYIITGTKSIQHLHNDFWIWKINNYGENLWDKNFGDTWSEQGHCGRETSDGNLIFTGLDRGPGYDDDLWLIKTDSNGNMLWNKAFGTGTGAERGRSVMQTRDNGFIIVGYAKNEYTTEPDKYDVWLIKTNVNGIIEWDRYFGEIGSEGGFCVQQTDDNGYIICGFKEDNLGFCDIWLLKTNDTGNLMWNKTFGGMGDDVGCCVKQTCEGGFIIVGYTNSTGAGDYDIWLIKTNETGFMEWNITFGGEKPDYGKSVWVTNDCGYIITGNTNSSGNGGFDVWLIKLAPELIPDIPILELVNIKGGVLGFSVGLKNFGNKTAYDITWEMTVLDGLLFPNNDSGEILELEPDEEIRIPLKWKFGLGKSTIEFRCHYTISTNGNRAGFDVSAKQEWNDLGFLIGHAFPEFMQPVKEWKDIESYSYQEEVKAQGVFLKYEGINQWHNVRVVRGLDSGSSEVAFYGLCKFTNGEAFIEEGWITKSDIESALAHWQVELVDGV